MSNYWRKKLEELEGGNKKSSNTTSNSSNSSDYWQNKMNELDEENRRKEEDRKKNEDIAPILSMFSKPAEDDEEEDERKWFQKGAFEDGFSSFGNFLKMNIGSARDLEENLWAGILGMGEKAVDAGAYLVGGAANLVGADEFADKTKDFIAKDLYDEKKVAEKLVAVRNPLYLLGDTDDSIYGEKTDSLVQSGGQLAATAGLQAVGVPWFLTTGVTSFGSEAENAFNQGANYLEAGGSALISAGAEILTEKLSGGIKFGGKTLDDVLLKPLIDKISSKATRTLVNLGVDAAGEGFEEVASEFLSTLGQQLTYEKEETWQELLTNETAMDSYINQVSDALFGEEARENYKEAAIGGMVLGGGMGGFKATSSIASGRDYKSGLTTNEQKVVDKVVEERIAEAEKNGEKLTKKDKSKIYNEVLEDLKKGGISTDTIESVLGGDTYKSYQDTVSSEDALIKELEELRKMKKGEMNDIQQDRLAELKAMNLTDTTKRDGLRAQLSESVQKQLTRQTKFGTQADNYLIESYNERGRRGQAFQADPEQYKNEYAKQTVQNALEFNKRNKNGIHNGREAHDFIDLCVKIAEDKGKVVDFTTTAEMAQSIKNGNPDNLKADPNLIEAYNSESGNKLVINMDVNRSLTSLVGHEITDMMRGAKAYSELQKAAFSYAETKGELETRRSSVKNRYKTVNADLDGELTSDLVGDYLFTDSGFIQHLSANHRNVFQKIYDEIKYLYKLATAGSKEARQLEKLKHEFEKVWRDNAKSESKASVDTKYSLTEVEAVQPSSDKWKRTATTEEAKAKFPQLWDVSSEESDVRNPTQIKNTVNTYRRLYERLKAEGFDGTILDASSGLGYGTKAGIEEYGFNVEDIEPYPDNSYKPKYTDYSKLDKKYDAIISSFVLNVLPQDQRDALVVKMGELLNDGGRMFVNTRSNDVESLAKTGKNIHLGKWEWIETARGSYQKGFMKDELVAYLKDALGEGFTVEPTNFYSPVAAIVTKNGDVKYSLSDSDGKQLTKEQSKYFKDSKMRDENGNLKVMYHGSQDAGFHTFDAIMSDDDTSFFFVDRNDVAASYSGTSETYEAQTIRTAEDMNNFIESIGVDGYEVVEKDGKFTLLYEGERVADSNTAQGIYDEFCWYEGVGEGDANYKVYLNLTNPLEIDAKGRPWNKIDAEFSQEVYDKYKSLTAEEKAALTDLAEWEDFRVFNSEIQEARDNDLASAYAKMGEDVNIYDLFSVAADNFSEDSMRENARNYLKTRDYAQRAKEQGYDGVIFKNLVDNGGYSNGSEGASTVAIAFDSNQIKSVANEKPTGDPDIRYSLSDSEGAELSTEQQEFFKDSKIRNKNGSLKVMHHGSFETFTVFDKRKAKSGGTYGKGFYFTDSTSHAGTYGKILDVYLNITNPLQNGTNDITKEQLRKFVKAIAEDEDYGIDNYGYDATIDSVTDSVYGKGDFGMILDLNVTCIGDMVEAIELFNEVNGTDYNGIVAPTETVAFYPNQIKSINNKAPTADPDIRYSLSEDSQGRELSAEQKEYFKDSKIVDDKGNLLVMYHGTKKGGFTVFENKNRKSTEGFYFTNDKEYSNIFEGIKPETGKYYDVVQEGIDEGYFSPETYEVYLDVKNPLVLTMDNQDIIEDIGYWGNIYTPIKNAGYDGVMLEDKSQVFVFNSNQIKRVDNTKPTSDPDIRYSLSEYTAEEKKAHNKAVLEHFGKTYSWAETGYLLLDGTRLDLSGKHDGAPGGYRTVDHRDITEALGYDYGGGDYSGSLVQFMSEGNIRIIPECNGINLSVKPTEAQEQALSSYISRYRGEVLLDIDDLNGNTVVSVEYPYGTYYTKVLNDIREWFDNGKKPENSGSYSLTKEGETPKAYGNFNIYAKDIRLAPTKEEVAPLNETTSSKMEQVEDVAPTPEDMAEVFPSEPNLYDLERELQGLEEQLEEAANANDIDTVNSLLSRYDELLKNVHKMRAEEAAENSERIASLEDTDAPLETESAYSEADTTPLNNKTLNTLTRNVRDILACLPKDNKAIREVIEKYSTSENPSKSELFKEIREKFGEKYVFHRYADIAEVKKLLNTYKFNVSDRVKSDITDYTDFKKAHNVRTSKNALSVDVLYEELSGLYPGLFPPDIIAETDRFERISEVSVIPTREWVKEGDLSDDEIMQAVDLIHNEVNKYKNTEARKAAEAEAREHLDSIAPSLAEEIIGAPLKDRTGEVKNVKERLSEKIQNVETELADNKRLRADSMVDFNREIARLQDEYAEKANKNTKVANDILRRIERLQTMKNNVDADYAKRISDLEARAEKMNSATYQTAMQRQSKTQEYRQWAADLIGDTTTWQDKKLGISYKINTLKRNLRDVVRDARGSRDIAKADAIYDELQGKYNHNEAELNREANRIKKVFADMKITASEDAYIQMLGELLYNPETTLTPDNVNKYYEAHKSKIDIDKVNEAIKLARANYDSLLERVNEVLSEQGMKEIPYRKGYFPHFTEEKQSRLAKLFNWKTHDTEIPTSIAGLTEEFTPNRSWQSFNKERYTDTTDYSFTKGFDTYVQGALDWIYHIEDIQKRRAFENQLRYIHSEQGIKDRVEALFNNEEYDADELQEQIDLIYREAQNPLNNFVTDLRAGTNTLANKKSSMDRGMEEATNRKFYSTMTNINNRVTGNMVVGSVSSALTNFIPITQSWSQVSPFSSLRAAGETIRSTFRDDGVIDKSDFLTNRLKKADNLYKTTWDKLSDKAAFMMEGVDFFTSQTVWRSKYSENISNGMSESEAIKNADEFAEGILAGRSRGNQPTLFDSKNPLIKAFTAFQLEVNNQYGYMFKDMPQDMKNESTAKLVKGYVAMFVGAYAYNALYSSLTGRNAAFDPIRIIQELLGDLFDEDEEKEPIDAVMNLANNVIEELPFVGGLFGGGRIPISSMLPYGEGLPEMIDGTYQDLKDEDWSNLTKEWLNPLYYLAMPFGGGQLKKTVEGLSMFSEDHPIAGSYTASGNLRFPVEDTFLNRLQAAIFGQWANKNARDYFDNDIAPLNENQTEEYIDVDMSIQDYWEYRKGLKGLKTLEEKAEYINSLDLTDKQKNILINNIADRKEDLDMSNYGDFGSFEEFDYASKNPEKYAFLQENGISYDDYNASEESREAYSWAYNNPEKYTLSKAICSDVVTYRKYSSELYDIKADKDEDGKSISGSRKEKVIDYINNLDADYGEKIILFKSEYNADDTYNYEIIDYLNSREDISYKEMETILKELGFTVDSKGNIYWD